MLSVRLFSVGRGLATSAALRNATLEVSELAPYVTGVKMNRPKQRNAFTLDMWNRCTASARETPSALPTFRLYAIIRESITSNCMFREFTTTFEKLGDDPKCRVIVLSGAGKSFCAGIDLKEGVAPLMQLIQDDTLDISRKGRKMREVIKTCQDGFTAIAKCPKPVIAAVHSHCIGAGIDVITACDIRYASQDSIFSIKEVDIGLAADVGTLQRIGKVVGNDSVTRELAMTARDFMSDEALRIGLLSRVFPDAESTFSAALELAKVIAEKSPVAVQGTKIHLNYSRDHTADEGLEYIRTWNMSQLLSEDLLKAGMAAINKSKTTFNDV